MKSSDSPGRGSAAGSFGGAVFPTITEFPDWLGVLEAPSGFARVTGGCGDTIEVSFRVEDGLIKEIKARPTGCGYTRVCAFAMCGLAKGATPDDASQIEPEAIMRILPDLPEDHLHCVRLALDSLCAAVEDYYRKTSAGPNPG